MSHADLTHADHDLLVRIAREQATKAVAAAIDAALDYGAIVRQKVAHRLGVPAVDKAVSDDPTCRKIMDVYVTLGLAQSKLGEVEG
jgi:hypothetical protein